MTIEDIIEYYGTGIAACKALGISKQNITNWKVRGKVPMYAQFRFEKHTKGKLIAKEEKPADFSLENKEKDIFKYKSNDYGICSVASVSKNIKGGYIIKYITNNNEIKTGFNLKNLIINK